jgi:putative tricarboxylic transport membrane protein
VRIVAGTAAGGGLDRAARALARVIEQQRLLEVAVEVVNIPGDGARRVWTELDRNPGDAHLLCISSPNLTTDRLLGLAAFDLDTYTPLATLLTEYIAFLAPSRSALVSAQDLLARFARNDAMAVALSTAVGNPNHIALAQVIRHAGGDVRAPTIRALDTAVDVVAEVAAEKVELGAVTAASTTQAMLAGDVRLLAVSAPARLAAPFESVPTWTEQGVACVVGAWRGVSGPAGLSSAQTTFWTDIFARVTRTPQWERELAAHCWAPMYLGGVELAAYLRAERAAMSATLSELGLIENG